MASSLVSARHYRISRGLRTENVKMDGRRARIPRAGARDGLHHQGRLRQAEACAAIFLRERNSKPAAFGHGIAKRFGPVAGFISLSPIFVIELRHSARDTILNGELIFAERADRVHVKSPIAEDLCCIELAVHSDQASHPFRNWQRWGKSGDQRVGLLLQDQVRHEPRRDRRQ